MQVSRWSVATGVICLGALLSFSVGGCPATGGTDGSIGTLNTPPTAIVSSDLVRGVVPLTVRFSSDRSTDDGAIVSRVWDFGDGATSNEISPLHTFTQTGVFNVRLTLTDEQGLSTSRTLRITVTQSPVPVITVDRTSAPNAPAIINFSSVGSFDPDGEITQYQWDFGDNTREFFQNVAHQYSTAGTFRATLTVTDNAGVSASEEILVSIGIPVPTVEIRTPPPGGVNIVVSPDSPLWVQAAIGTIPGVPRTVRAGLDRDRDSCNAQAASVVLNTNTVARRFEGHGAAVNDIALNANGSVLLTASSDGTLRSYNATTGALIGSVTGSPPTLAASAVNAVAFSPTGDQFAYGLGNGRVVLRRTSDLAIISVFTSHTATVNDVAFSPDGSRILSGGGDRRAILWNISDGSILRDFTHPLGVNGVAFSPADSTIVATACADNIARAWSVTSGAVIGSFAGHTEPVNAVLFSADGLTLFTASDDDTARSWDVATGGLKLTLNGTGGNVFSLALSTDGLELITGDASGVVRQWTLATGTAVNSGVAPCASAVRGMNLSSDGEIAFVSIAAGNDIQLDTDPSSGQDINLNTPRALDLSDVDPGQYTLWVEVDTDRTDATREYADPIISVIAAFTSAPDATTPVIPLVNDRASVVVGQTRQRQVFDIGPMAAGDQLIFGLLGTPSYVRKFETTNDFSVAVLDGSSNVFAWYQKFSTLVQDPANPFNVRESIFRVDFDPNTRLVFARAGQNHYVVTDGGNSVDIEIRRAQTVVKRPQRVFVNFAGAAAAGAGQRPTESIPALSATAINSAWGATELLQMKTGIINQLNLIYSGLAIEFISSDVSQESEIQLPFLTVQVGGTNPNVDGISDYIDPRNETLTGTCIVYATTIGTKGLNGDYANTLTTAIDVGNAIGRVAAHQVGHLLGLRNTVGNPTDIMGTGGGFFGAIDPTLPGLTLGVAELSPAEQYFDAPTRTQFGSIGNQDAAQLLEDTVGTN